MVADRMLYTLPIHVVETLVDISADALVDTAVGRADAVDVVVGIRALSSLLPSQEGGKEYHHLRSILKAAAINVIVHTLPRDRPHERLYCNLVNSHIQRVSVLLGEGNDGLLVFLGDVALNVDVVTHDFFFGQDLNDLFLGSVLQVIRSWTHEGRQNTTYE